MNQCGMTGATAPGMPVTSKGYMPIIGEAIHLLLLMLCIIINSDMHCSQKGEYHKWYLSTDVEILYFTVVGGMSQPGMAGTAAPGMVLTSVASTPVTGEALHVMLLMLCIIINSNIHCLWSMNIINDDVY